MSGTGVCAAMLTVDDPGFWHGLEPVRMGQLPHLQEQVTVIGCCPSVPEVVIHGHVCVSIEQYEAMGQNSGNNGKALLEDGT